MSDLSKVAATVREAIDQIEEAYEFMLAYAAQGRTNEAETEGESQIRGFLKRFRNSLDTVSSAVSQLIGNGSAGAAFSVRFTDDAAVMKSVLDLILERSSISSDMIDNTNGLIATRALLTDLFFIDQVLVAGYAPGS